MAFTDKIYGVNWNRLAVWFTETFLRNPVLLAFMQSVAGGSGSLHALFLSYKDYIAYWLEIDSQVWRMEKALNDKYDISQRRIKIVDAVEKLATPLFQPQENKPVVLRKNAAEGAALVLYTKAETGVFTVDFIVQVPVMVMFNMTEIRAFIDTFKTPGKTYSISIV